MLYIVENIFFRLMDMKYISQNHTESQNGRGWNGPLWVI